MSLTKLSLAGINLFIHCATFTMQNWATFLQLCLILKERTKPIEVQKEERKFMLKSFTCKNT
jgi:hypothetical protein